MKKRLLIVEDDELNRELFVQLFEDHYEIGLAPDGEAALGLASRLQPDLVLMDIGLPGMSGLDAMRAMRAADGPANVLIIAVSARVLPEDRDRAIDAGADAFLPKPIDVVSIVDFIDGAMRSR
jgi:CheY-like chemotaxis protein